MHNARGCVRARNAKRASGAVARVANSSISKAAGGAVRIAAGMLLACQMPQSALAAALATVLLGATAARAHWCTGAWSRTAVGAAAANDDALEPTLTSGRDRLQAMRWPTKAKACCKEGRATSLWNPFSFFLSGVPGESQHMVPPVPDNRPAFTVGERVLMNSLMNGIEC